MTTDEIYKSKKSKNPIGSAITSLLARLTGNSLTGAEQQANEYSSAEADKARAWNERMYLQYESPQGQVNQLKAAGLNPALMYGSAPTGSVDPVSSPESVSPGSGLDLFSAIANMASLKANIDRTKAETRNIESRTFGQDIENQFKPAIFEQNLRRGEIDIESTLAGIRQIDSQISLNSANIERIASAIKLNDAQIKSLLAETDKKIVETATEKLRQANIEASTRNIAASTLCEIQRASNIALSNVLYKQQEKLNEQSLRLGEQNIAESAANVRIANAQAVYEEYRQAFREYNGYMPDQPIWNAGVSALGQFAYDINPFNWFKKNDK